MKIPIRPIVVRTAVFGVPLASVLFSPSALAVDYYKANNTSSLNQNASWVDVNGIALGTTPTNTSASDSDKWIWDNRVLAANTPALGNDLRVRTIQIKDPGGLVTIDGVGNNRSITVTNGGGIDMSAATQDLTIQNLNTGSNVGYRLSGSNVALTFNIASGRTLTMKSKVAVASGSSGASITFSGAGTAIFEDQYQPSHAHINNGTVYFNRSGGSSRLSTNTTNITGGTLYVNNTSGSATGSGAVNVNNGGKLGGNGIMTGTVTTASGSTLSPGNPAVNSGIGSLTAGSLNLAAGTTLNWEITDPLTADVITVTANNGLTINGGTFNLYQPGTTLPFEGTGDFTLFNYTGSIAGAGVASLAVSPATQVSGHTYQFAISSGTVKLRITAGAISKTYWNVDADGTWSTGSNWTGGTAPDAIGTHAAFGAPDGATLTAPRTVTVDGTRVTSSLDFDSAQPFTLDGTGPLTLNDNGFGATVSVASGDHVISAPVSLTEGGALISAAAGSSLSISGVIDGFYDLSKAGAGTLILSGENTYLGATSVGNGTLQIGVGGTSGSLNGPVANSATLKFNRSDNTIFNYEISGTGSLVQAGSGTLTLNGNNTFSGITAINSGTLLIDTDLALQNSTLSLTTTGGPLALGDFISTVNLGGLSGDRNIPLANNLASPVSLTIGGNNSTTTYSGSGIGTGVLFTKKGSGTLTLTGTHAYSGNAGIQGGTLEIAGAGDFDAAAVTLSATAGTKLLVSGGTLDVTNQSLVTNASSGFEVSGGTATFGGGIVTEFNVSSGGGRVAVTGTGTLNTTSMSFGRGSLQYNAEPTAGDTTKGLYVNGGTANLTGTLTLGGGENSSVNCRMDAGILNVAGTTTLGINNTTRWSVIDINGGTFTSTDTVGGVLLGGANAGNVIMHIRNSGALAKIPRLQFGQAALAGISTLSLSDGALYVGSGGIVLGSSNPSFAAALRLSGGTLGATADMSCDVPVSLTGSAVVTAADETDTPYTATFSAAATGSGSLTKNGSGTAVFSSASNNFSGAATVNSGTLRLAGTAGSVSVAETATLSPIVALTATGGGSIDGTLAATYDGSLEQVSKLQTSGAITLGANSVLSINGTGTLTQSYYLLVQASGGISGSFSSVIGTVPAGYTLNTSFNFGGVPAIALVSDTAGAYDLWAAAAGLAGPSAAKSFDADKDGMSNLLEYALQGNPTLSDVSKLPVLGQSGNFLTLSFDHIADPALTYVVLASDSLSGTWNPVHTYPPFGSAGSTTYTDNVAVGSQPKRFLRLEVTSTP